MKSLVLLPALLRASCATACSAGMEIAGFHKRHILVSRVKKAKVSQVAAREEFQSALAEFRDHVLFLKPNLNARAVAAPEGKAAQVRIDVGRLIRGMEASIAEAEACIRDLNAVN